MAMLLAEPKLITGDELLAMSDMGPCELIDGRIISLTPPGSEHGVIEAILTWFLQNFVIPRKLGWVLSGEAGIYIRRHPDRVRGMDIAFISYQRQPILPKGYLTIAPELIIEIVSPSDRWRDVEDKIEEYFAIGVTRVWVVDPESQTVRIYQSALAYVKLNRRDTVRGEGILEDFLLPLEQLFVEA